MQKDWEELEKILKYSFKDKQLLEEALTHPSTSSSNKKQKRFNYERLEFLGDSILSFVIIDYLLRKYKNETEGQLSKRKSFLVSKQTVSDISRRLGIGDFIILSKGEEQSGGRNNINNLENVFEAILGAIFLDSDFCTVQKFIINIWSEFNEWTDDVPIDPKTQLQEWTQKHFKVLPDYKLLESKQDLFTIKLSIPEHEPIIYTSHSIKETELILAKMMLENIKNHK